MTALIIYILVNIGFTYIVTRSKICKPIIEYLNSKSPNFFGYWSQCPPCFGFLSGLITSLIWYSPTFFVCPISIFLYPILDGFLASGCCFIINELLNRKYD